MNRTALCAAVFEALAMAQVRAADPPDTVVELPAVQVIGTTPLPGLGVPLKDVPANVQTFGAREIDRQRWPTLGDFMPNAIVATMTHASSRWNRA